MRSVVAKLRFHCSQLSNWHRQHRSQCTTDECYFCPERSCLRGWVYHNFYCLPDDTCDSSSNPTCYTGEKETYSSSCGYIFTFSYAGSLCRLSVDIFVNIRQRIKLFIDHTNAFPAPEAYFTQHGSSSCSLGNVRIYHTSRRRELLLGLCHRPNESYNTTLHSDWNTMSLAWNVTYLRMDLLFFSVFRTNALTTTLISSTF